jgi:hypothetical protein
MVLTSAPGVRQESTSLISAVIMIRSARITAARNLASSLQSVHPQLIVNPHPAGVLPEPARLAWAAVGEIVTHHMALQEMQLHASYLYKVKMRVCNYRAFAVCELG